MCLQSEGHFGLSNKVQSVSQAEPAGMMTILPNLYPTRTAVLNVCNLQSKLRFATCCTLSLLSLPSATAPSPRSTFSSLPFLTTWRTKRKLRTPPPTLHSSTPPSTTRPPLAGNSIMLCSRCKGEVSATGVASPYLINEVISTLTGVEGGCLAGWLTGYVG